MDESHKYSETDRCVVYKQTDCGMELSMIFNLEIKTVDISMSHFIRNNEPLIVPMVNDADKYSAKYGHWQQLPPALGMEDVEFLHKKTKELFGTEK